MSDNIPQRIVEYAKHIAVNGVQHAWAEDRVDTLRNVAIEHIRRYKEAKKQESDREKEQAQIKEWLKSIGHETGK